MPEAGLVGHPSSPDDELCNDVNLLSSNLMEPCRDLLYALSELAARKHALDAERLEIAPVAYQEAVLNAVWVTRRNCDLLALAVQEAQPETGDDEAIRRDVLIFYSARVNPDSATLTSLSELPVGTVRALYPAVVLQRPSSSHGYG